MSSVRGPAGLPWTVTARYDPFSFETHSAVNMPGTLTKGVSIAGASLVHGRTTGAADAPLPRVERYACNSPLPPFNAAGLVQPAICSCAATLPNLEFAG